MSQRWTLQPIGDESRVNILGEGRELIAVACDNDARLIAAAPELLAALKDTLRALEAHLDDDTNHANLKSRDHLCPCNQEEVRRARAAIAKAEGQP